MSSPSTMMLELFFVAIWTFLTLQGSNGQYDFHNSGFIGRFAGDSLLPGGSSSFGGQRVPNSAISGSFVGQVEQSGLFGGDSGFVPSQTSLVGWYPVGAAFGGGFSGGNVFGEFRQPFDNVDSGFFTRFRQNENDQRLAGASDFRGSEGQQAIRNRGSIGRSAGDSVLSRGSSRFGGQRVNTTRSSSSRRQVEQSELLGGDSGFDPSLTSLVGWLPFGAAFGGEFGGRNVFGEFRQPFDNVDSGFVARFRQNGNDQRLAGASDFRRSEGPLTDTRPYYDHNVNHGYHRNDDYETKYVSDEKKGHGNNHKYEYEKNYYSDYKYNKKGYDPKKRNYNYKEDDENGYGRYYDGKRGNDRKEYDYKGSGEDGESNYYHSNSRYHEKGYSNYHKRYNKKGYYNKEYKNNNAYDDYDKKGYSGSGYHRYNGDRRDRQGDNDGWYQDRNGYSKHHRNSESRGEYDGYRENRYYDDGYRRRGRYNYHDERQHRGNSGYYQKQYNNYRREPEYYGAGTKTYENQGYNGKYDNYASNDYRFDGQYLYGLSRDRSQGFRHGPNSGRGYYENKKKYDNY